VEKTHEEPYLLDPADPEYPGLIDCDEERRSRPSVCTVTDRDKQRVELSYHRYRLDYEPLDQERQRVWDECRRKIHDCHEALANVRENESPAARAKVKHVMADSRSMCREQLIVLPGGRITFSGRTTPAFKCVAVADPQFPLLGIRMTVEHATRTLSRPGRIKTVQ
jgi:hypothetical protein